MMGYDGPTLTTYAAYLFGSIAVGSIVLQVGSIVIDSLKTLSRTRIKIGDRFVEIRPGMTDDEFNRAIDEALRE